MHEDFITRRDDLMIRRLVLEPGEPMRWHTDVCDRFTVVVRGEELTIEFRDTGVKMDTLIELLLLLAGVRKGEAQTLPLDMARIVAEAQP